MQAYLASHRRWLLAQAVILWTVASLKLHDDAIGVKSFALLYTVCYGVPIIAVCCMVLANPSSYSDAEIGWCWDATGEVNILIVVLPMVMMAVAAFALAFWAGALKRSSGALQIRGDAFTDTEMAVQFGSSRLSVLLLTVLLQWGCGCAFVSTSSPALQHCQVGFGIATALLAFYFFLVRRRRHQHAANIATDALPIDEVGHIRFHSGVHHIKTDPDCFENKNSSATVAGGVQVLGITRTDSSHLQHAWAPGSQDQLKMQHLHFEWKESSSAEGDMGAAGISDMEEEAMMDGRSLCKLPFVKESRVDVLPRDALASSFEAPPTPAIPAAELPLYVTVAKRSIRILDEDAYAEPQDTIFSVPHRRNDVCQAEKPSEGQVAAESRLEDDIYGEIRQTQGPVAPCGTVTIGMITGDGREPTFRGMVSCGTWLATCPRSHALARLQM